MGYTDYASFWGLTAPQLVLNDINLDVFKTAVQLLDNPQDSHKLKSLLWELNKMQEFIKTGLVYDFEDPVIRKKFRQLEQSKLHYSEGKAIRPNMLIPKDELVDFEETLNAFPKILQQYIMVGSKRVDISDNAFKIIKVFCDMDYVIEDYKRCINIHSSSEIQVFNRKLEDILIGNPAILKNRYLQKIQRASNNKVILESTINGMKNDISILLKLIEDEDNTADINIKNIRLARDTDLSQFDEKTELFVNKLLKLDVAKTLTEKELYTLTELFKIADQTNLEFYNSMFDLNLSLAEYEAVFFELDRLGLIGLNFYAVNYLENSLMNTLLLRTSKNEIPFNSPLAFTISEINRALDSMLSFGSDLEVSYINEE